MIVASDVPFSLADIDAGWLTRALREGGVIRDEEVTAFSHRIIGEETGFLGEVAILDMTYSDDATDAPASIVLKIPTALKNRRMGQSMGVYEKEIRFYRDLKPKLNIRAPAHYYSALNKFDDPDVVMTRLERLHRSPIWVIALVSLLLMWFTGLMPRRYVLLIEDVSHLRLGDQVEGCSDDDLKNALRTMAQLHAQYWDTAELHAMTWVQPGHLTSKLLHMMFLQANRKFLDANRDSMSASQVQMFEWLNDNGIALTELLGAEPRTLLHGDFRLDNLCFDDQSGEVLVLDWQTMLTGSAGGDLAYFLSASVPLGAGRGVINELLDFYRDCLAENGVAVSSEWLHWQYEAGMLFTLYKISQASNQQNLDMGVDRGPALLRGWIDKILDKLDGVDLDSLLQRRAVN